MKGQLFRAKDGWTVCYHIDRPYPRSTSFESKELLLDPDEITLAEQLGEGENVLFKTIYIDDRFPRASIKDYVTGIAEERSINVITTTRRILNETALL